MIVNKQLGFVACHAVGKCECGQIAGRIVLDFVNVSVVDGP